MSELVHCICVSTITQIHASPGFKIKDPSLSKYREMDD